VAELINRFARIYPVYFLLLTIAVLIGPRESAGTLLQNYTLTHALFHGTPLIIQPSWSLTVEECFYFLAPLFMLLARRYNFLAPFALGCGLFVAAVAISRLGVAFLGTPGFMLTTTFFAHFVEFFAGFWLALVVMKLEKRGALRARGSWRTLAGIAAVAVLIIAMIMVYRQRPLNFRAIILINNFLIPAPIALLYLGLLREDTPLARALSGSTAGLLGRSSYSFYLLHSLMIDNLEPVLPLTNHRLLSVVITFAIAWLASILLFVGYEEPVNISIRRKFRSKESWVGLQATLFRVRS
jgi:peptidoglycan/LPS O-acetylase OafA/YrhL